MDIRKYLDSTYLKTTQESGLHFQKNLRKVYELILETHENNIFAVMIRPDHVDFAKKLLVYLNSNVKIGTVISFPEGNSSTEDKLNEAKKAIIDGADELDFVVNYTKFKNGDLDLIKNEFIECSKLCINNNKIIKWIIETAALSSQEIESICKIFSSLAEEHFHENLNQIFIKSSTGYYNSSPSGATPESIKLMIENSGKLPIKASGGIKNYKDAKMYIDLGVKRIGTSNALAIVNEKQGNNDY